MTIGVVVGRTRRLLSVIVVAVAGMGLVSCEGIPTDFVSGAETRGKTTIPDGAQMIFDPEVSTTLTMTGNLIVEGTLIMRPANPGVVHKIVFATADESAFDGATPLDHCGPPECNAEAVDDDQGLWVLKGGRLDISGAVKEPWGRATTSLAAGATSLTLDRAATGWRVGDEIAITPTAPDDYTHEPRTITAVSGNQVTFSALTREHPSVTLPDGTVTTAEVLNLTRNVRIEGKSPGTRFPRIDQPNNPGRSHIFIQNNTPVQQTIDYTTIRYMGPRKASGSTSVFVLGRYGLHFHMSGENNRGTVVTGTVVRDTGSHAYVPHMSNGVTFRRTISLDTLETAYWWDVKANEESNLSNDRTDDIRYEETVAGGIGIDPAGGSMRPAGYTAACGEHNAIVGSVAFGVQNGTQASGILWPEGANGCNPANDWAVGSTTVHNNKGAGLFTWQNTQAKHRFIDGIAVYRNGGTCLRHGAYTNRFDYSNIHCYDNRGNWQLGGYSEAWRAEVVIEAVTGGSDPSQLNGFVIRGPRAVNALRFPHRGSATPSAPTTLRGWDVGEYTGHAIAIRETNLERYGRYDFVCWTLPGGAELTLADFTVERMHENSVYRVQPRDPALPAYRVNRDGTATNIADFATC